jgi:putative SOS response-associated peptidase YedK
MTKNVDEVARWFDAINEAGGANIASEVYPGYPGLVVAEGNVRSMSWGFPLERKGKSGQPLKPRPVNNARTDKLDSYFWRYSFTERRCLIPLTAWAEAEGPKGAKTRTWMSPAGDGTLFACAGLWRESDAFGQAYAMVMTDAASSPAAEVHARMPVLLAREDHGRWLSGSPEEAKSLCKAWRGELTIERSDQPWSGASAPAAQAQKGLF